MAKNTSVMMQASVVPQPLPPINLVRFKTQKPLLEAERTSRIHNLAFEGGGAKRSAISERCKCWKKKVSTHTIFSVLRAPVWEACLHCSQQLGVPLRTCWGKCLQILGQLSKNILEFALNMLEAVTRDFSRANQGLGERDRIVPIDTDYAGTTTFDLVQDDPGFMINSGRNHTKAFLSHHR